MINTMPIRDKLIPYLQKPHRLYLAEFNRYDVTPHGRATVLLTNVIDIETEEVVADHVWIPRSSELKAMHPKEGHKLLFKAKVIGYAKGHTNNLQRDYRFDKIRDIKLFKSYKGVDLSTLKEMIASLN